MELNLKGKVVVITGGGSGIGKAVALEYLKEGAKVAICGRTLAKLEVTRDEFKAQGYDIFIKTADVTDEKSFTEFADAVVDEFSGIDIWYNNAGANQIKPLLEYTTEEFRKMTDLLFVSVFTGSMLAAKRMKNGGVIMNASSFSAIDGNAGRAPYSSCKAGVTMLSRTLAAELAPLNIRVLSYIPGVIATELNKKNITLNGEALMRDIPQHRFGKPEDLAKVLVFASSECADYVNGTEIVIAGGKRCVQNPQYAWDIQK